MACPSFTQHELDHYNATVQEAMGNGDGLVDSKTKACGEDLSRSHWEETCFSRYP